MHTSLPEGIGSKSIDPDTPSHTCAYRFRLRTSLEHTPSLHDPLAHSSSLWHFAPSSSFVVVSTFSSPAFSGVTVSLPHFAGGGLPGRLGGVPFISERTRSMNGCFGSPLFTIGSLSESKPWM